MNRLRKVGASHGGVGESRPGCASHGQPLLWTAGSDHKRFVAPTCCSWQTSSTWPYSSPTKVRRSGRLQDCALHRACTGTRHDASTPLPLCRSHLRSLWRGHVCGGPQKGEPGGSWVCVPCLGLGAPSPPPPLPPFPSHSTGPASPQLSCSPSGATSWPTRPPSGSPCARERRNSGACTRDFVGEGGEGWVILQGADVLGITAAGPAHGAAWFQRSSSLEPNALNAG